MAEIKESYKDLIDKILSLGSIKDIVNDRGKLLQILTYDGDRHLTAFFYELLNGALENGLVSSEDLEANIRSGWLARATIELKDHLVGRELFDFEIGDKINYASLLSDPESQLQMFTQPEIVKAIAGTGPNPGNELSYCQNSFNSWNVETQFGLISGLLKEGNVEKALMFVDDVRTRLSRIRKYEEDQKVGRGGR